jgi:hypothetical protein
MQVFAKSAVLTGPEHRDEDCEPNPNRYYYAVIHSLDNMQVKVQLSLCTPRDTDPPVTFMLDGGQWSALGTRYFISQVKGSPAIINRVLAGPTAGLDALERRKELCTCREMNHVA